MVTEDSTATAKIYDVTGKQIRMIQLDHIPAGNYVEVSRAIYWDGSTNYWRICVFRHLLLSNRGRRLHKNTQDGNSEVGQAHC